MIFLTFMLMISSSSVLFFFLTEEIEHKITAIITGIVSLPIIMAILTNSITI